MIRHSVSSSSSCYFVKKEEEEEEGERKITHLWMDCCFSVRLLKLFHLSSGLSLSLSLLPPRSFPDSRATSLSLFLFSLSFLSVLLDFGRWVIKIVMLKVSQFSGRLIKGKSRV